MQKNILWILMLVLLLVFSSLSQADAGKKGQKAKKGSAKALALIKVRGDFIDFNKMDSTLTIITEEGQLLDFKFNKNTKFLKGKKNIKLADIKYSAFIAVEYFEKNEIKIARNVYMAKKTSGQNINKTKRE